MSSLISRLKLDNFCSLDLSMGRCSFSSVVFQPTCALGTTKKKKKWKAFRIESDVLFSLESQVCVRVCESWAKKTDPFLYLFPDEKQNSLSSFIFIREVIAFPDNADSGHSSLSNMVYVYFNCFSSSIVSPLQMSHSLSNSFLCLFFYLVYISEILRWGKTFYIRSHIADLDYYD